MNKFASFALALLFSLLLGGCSGPSVKDPNAAAWEFNLNDAVPWTMRNAIKNNPIKLPLAMIVTDKKGTPLENVEVHVLLKTGTLELRTDAGGIFTVPFDTAIIAANPTVSLRKAGYKAGDFDLEVSGKTVSMSSDDTSFEVLNYRNLHAMEAGDFKVLHAPADKALAAQYLDTFLLVNKHFTEISGLQNMTLIYPIITQSNSVTTVGEQKGESMIPVNINSWQSMYWFYTHENIEANLMDPLTKGKAYDRNHLLRWVGDGIAEYTSMKTLERINPAYKNKMLNSRIASLEKYPDAQFDLSKWSMKGGHVVGYSYALAFWIGYEKAYGEAAVREFIAAFTKLQDYETAGVLKLVKNSSILLEKPQALAALEGAKVK